MSRFSSVKPSVCVVGSLANPEIDAVRKGCSNAPVLFHIGYHYENTIIKIAVARLHDAIRPANCLEYHAWHSQRYSATLCMASR